MMVPPGCPVEVDFDPLSPGFLADPYAVLALSGKPVFFAPSIGYYVVTRYADIEQVFRDPQTYSAAVAQAPLVPLVPSASWRPGSPSSSSPAASPASASPPGSA